MDTREEARSPLSAGARVAVMTYNIRIGSGPDGPYSGFDSTEQLRKIGRFILESGADIVLLQEVDQGCERSLELDQPAILAETTGFQMAFAPAREYPPGWFGVALLSRWPIRDAETVRLYRPDYSASHPGVPDFFWEQRVALKATVETPAGPVCVINTHLGLTLDQRCGQLEEIARMVRKSSLPVIFGGDLNSEPDERGLLPVRELLRDVYHDIMLDSRGFTANVPIAKRTTFPAGDDAPDLCLDYIFVSPDRLKPSEVRVMPEAFSDHLALLAVLETI